MISFDKIQKPKQSIIELKVFNEDVILFFEKRDKKKFEFDWIVKSNDDFKSKGKLNKITEDVFNFYDELIDKNNIKIKNQNQLINYLKGKI